MRHCVAVCRSLSGGTLTSILSLGVSLLFSTAGFAAGPSVELSKQSLTIRGITPGGQVALVGVAREPAYYMSRIVARQELLVDSDSGGTVQYHPAAGVSFQSIWVAVDLSTGAYVVVSPGERPPIVMTQRGAARGRAVEAIANTIDVGRSEVTILVVRPGLGAWALTARDGGAGDRDGTRNGRLRLDTSRLTSLSADAGGPPNALRDGDIVAVLDASELEYKVIVVGQGGN